MSIHDYFGRDIRLRHLRVLVAIDDHGQLTRAAKALHITQPALSKALGEIERAVGEPLFERNLRGMVATRAGAAVLRAARTTLAELERAGAELQGLRQSGDQSLAVGVMPTVAMTLLAPALVSMLARADAPAVHVVDGPTLQLLPQLAAGRLHVVLGAQVRAVLPDGIQGIELPEDPLVFVVAARHPLARKARPSWEECVALPWVLPPRGNNVRAVLEQRLRAQGMALPKQVVEAQSVDVIVALLEQAGAASFVPARLAGELQQRGVAQMLGGGHAQRVGMALTLSLFVPAGPIAPKCQVFIEAVREAMNLQRVTRAWA